MSGCLALKPALRKQRVTIMLDAGLVEYCKVQVGERGDQTLVDATLRQAVQGDELEARLRRIVREAMRRETATVPAAT